MGNPTKDDPPNPQSSATADPARSAESSSHPFLAPAVSAPTQAMERESTRKTQTRPSHGKVPLPVHPTVHRKEKLPDGFPVPSLERMFTVLFRAPRPVGDAPPVLDQLRNAATHSWLNLLLVFIPISWAAVSDFPLT